MDGLPLRPVLISSQEARPVPDGAAIRQTVRSFLARPISANIMEKEEYDAAVSGMHGDPNTEQVPQEYCWPALQLEEPLLEEVEQSSGRKTLFAFPVENVARCAIRTRKKRKKI